MFVKFVPMCLLFSSYSLRPQTVPFGSFGFRKKQNVTNMYTYLTLRLSYRRVYNKPYRTRIIGLVRTMY